MKSAPTLHPTPFVPRIRVLADLPAPVRDEVDQVWQAYLETAAEQGVAVPRQADFHAVLLRVWAGSDFVAQTCAREPELLADLLDSGDLLSDYAPEELAHKTHCACASAVDEAALGIALRILRRREMLRIAWRDLAGWADLRETCADLSALASACLDAALARLDAWQRKESGTPRGGSGKPQSLVVLGMGKLGAAELNFSSDIDLIFAYTEEGQTRPNGTTNEEYFIRLGQRLIRAISATTDDGQVFRVDMRLRPYGDSGPLAMGFQAMEEYYQHQGRDWERYALIKASPVAGDREAGAAMIETLRPFIYRRYLDYGTFAALRDMKAMISRELERKGLADNIKLGPGGIREVEFIGQAFQLIRGGREPDLQERGILTVLARLAEREHLPEYVSRGLREAYVFLRRLENRVQAYQDTQSHELPTDPLIQARLAIAMGFADWPTLRRALDKHRHLVQDHFEQVFAAPQAAGTALPNSDLDAVCRGVLTGVAAAAVLTAAGLDDTEEALRLLTRLREGFGYRALSSKARERMDQLLPMLISAVGAVAQPTATLQRVIGLLEAVAGRSAYLALLVENPMALSQLVQLFAASPWIARQLTRHPILLDELLDPRSLYAPLDKIALAQELLTLMQPVPDDDLERQMETLRWFKQANVLRVAAADIAAAMPLMVVSDHLTEIAETALREVLGLAWEHLVARHGRPQYRIDDAVHEAGFIIVAYGKLGGIELGYGSDLDLVFLHDGVGTEQRTIGPKRVDNGVFFARLGQRIIHMLNTLTPSGVLYDVDMRLRPSGDSGLLVSSLEAFADYQRNEAWTWEHQALVRARVVAGDPALAARFESVRSEVLGRRRNADELRVAVRDMRERMRVELAVRGDDHFDLKQDRGGIADIEFMVQYGVLAWASKHPQLLVYTDNIRLLDGFAHAGLMAAADSRLLADAYRAYRARLHRLTLQEESAVADAREFQEYREGVAALWRKLMDVD